MEKQLEEKIDKQSDHVPKVLAVTNERLQEQQQATEQRLQEQQQIMEERLQKQLKTMEQEQQKWNTNILKQLDNLNSQVVKNEQNQREEYNTQSWMIVTIIITALAVFLALSLGLGHNQTVTEQKILNIRLAFNKTESQLKENISKISQDIIARIMKKSEVQERVFNNSVYKLEEKFLQLVKERDELHVTEHNRITTNENALSSLTKFIETYSPP